MYRLAAYSRDDCQLIKEIALEELANDKHWYCKVAALFCLHTFALDAQDLERVARLIDSVERPQAIRAAFSNALAVWRKGAFINRRASVTIQCPKNILGAIF